MFLKHHFANYNQRTGEECLQQMKINF